MSLKEMAPRYQVGDRVSIDKSVTTMPALPAYVGVVQNVVPSYVDKTVGYNLALDGDPTYTAETGSGANAGAAYSGSKFTAVVFNTRVDDVLEQLAQQLVLLELLLQSQVLPFCFS